MHLSDRPKRGCSVDVGGLLIHDELEQLLDDAAMSPSHCADADLIVQRLGQQRQLSVLKKALDWGSGSKEVHCRVAGFRMSTEFQGQLGC